MLSLVTSGGCVRYQSISNNNDLWMSSQDSTPSHYKCSGNKPLSILAALTPCPLKRIDRRWGNQLLQELTVPFSVGIYLLSLSIPVSIVPSCHPDLPISVQFDLRLQTLLVDKHLVLTKRLRIQEHYPVLL